MFSLGIKLFSWLSGFITRGRSNLLVLIVGLFILSLSVFLSLRLKVRTNYIDLFDEKDQIARDYLYALRNFGGLDYLYLGVESEDVESTRSLVDSLTKELENLEGVEQCISKIPLDFFRKNRLMFLPYDQLQIWVEKLASVSRKRDLEEVVAEFFSRMPSSLPGEGYFLSRDGRMFLLKLKPSYSSEDIDKNSRLISRIVEIIQKKSEGVHHRAILVGAHREVLEDVRTIKADVKETSFIALAGVLMVLWLVFGRLKLPFLAGVTLIVGLAMTLALVALIWGRLIILTALFPAALIGLGIDYIIHLFARLEEGSAEQALKLTGPALMIGALTTSAAFYALTFSRLRGFQEMGIMGGTGVLFLLLSSLFIFPSLYTLRKRRYEERKSTIKGLNLLRGIAEWVISKRRAVLTAGILLLPPFIYLALKIDYQTDWREIRGKAGAAFTDREHLLERFGISPDYALVIAQDLQSTREATAQLRERVKQGDTIGKVLSIADYIPEEQEEKLKLLLELKRNFRRLDFHRNPFLAYLDRYLESKKIEPEDLPLEVRYQFIGRDGRYLIYVHPRKYAWEENFAKKFIDEIKGALNPSGSYTVTGGPILYRHMLDLMKADFRRCTLEALLLVTLLLGFGFWSLRLALLALIPVFMGVIFMLGSMKILGFSFNFANILVTPLILGIGIDDGVHVIHRIRRGVDQGIPSAVARVGMPIIATSLTTMIGFGTFMLSEFQGLQSMGLEAVLGIGYCMLFSLLVLPALLSF